MTLRPEFDRSKRELVSLDIRDQTKDLLGDESAVDGAHAARIEMRHRPVAQSVIGGNRQKRREGERHVDVDVIDAHLDQWNEGVRDGLNVRDPSTLTKRLRQRSEERASCDVEREEEEDVDVAASTVRAQVVRSEWKEFAFREIVIQGR